MDPSTSSSRSGSVLALVRFRTLPCHGICILGHWSVTSSSRSGSVLAPVCFRAFDMQLSHLSTLSYLPSEAVICVHRVHGSQRAVVEPVLYQVPSLQILWPPKSWPISRSDLRVYPQCYGPPWWSTSQSVNTKINHKHVDYVVCKKLVWNWNLSINYFPITQDFQEDCSWHPISTGNVCPSWFCSQEPIHVNE